MRKHILLILAAMAFSSCVSSACQAQQFVFDELSDPHFRRILRGMGHDEIEVLDESENSTTMLVVIHDLNVVVMNYHESRTARIFAVFTNEEGETEETLELANAWNRDRRFSKVLIDDNGSWVIESDFDVGSGITQEQLEAWIDTWVVQLNNFSDYLNDNG